jgi:hypothetical protein
MWEYNVVCATANPTLKSQMDALDQVGAKGWELVAVVREHSTVWFYLKRKKEQP